MLRWYIVIVAALAFIGSQLARGPGIVTSRPESVSSPVTEIVQPDDTSSQTPTFARAAEGALSLDRNPDGHFYADVRINGASVHMLIDTGASGIALSRDDARTAGLATSIGMNDVVGEGADGAVRGEYVKLDKVELGPLSAGDMDAVVLNSGQQSLLGQSFLSRFSSVQIEGDHMVLR